MDIFDILDDLSDELSIGDYLRFLTINEVVHELKYKTVRFVEYHYLVSDTRSKELNPQIFGIIINYVCHRGDLEVVKWFHYRGHKFTSSAMDSACKGGHLKVVEWLHQNRKEGCSRHAMGWACCYGHLDVADWLLKNRSEGCTRFAMAHAARFGQLETIRWMIKNDVGINSECIKSTIKSIRTRYFHFTPEWREILDILCEKDV